MDNQKSYIPNYNFKANFVHHPHVVILGAGASLAAFPNGDRYGKKLPLMNDIVKVVGLETVLNSINSSFDSSNFEEVFSNLYSKGSEQEYVNQLERAIYDYFKFINIPDELTLYDKLILSLRETDLIATFNWDPLLCLAYQRNRHLKKLPLLAFPHGNVFVGTCKEHKKMGFINSACSVCGKFFSKVELLYPIKEKDYTIDPFIKGEWTLLTEYLNRAVFVTIFGYSAPKTDVSARQLMLNCWNENNINSFAQIEIIDIKPKEKIEESWSEFFLRNHYFTSKSFEESYLYHYPRRSAEAFVSAFLQNDPWGSIEHYRGNSLPEYQNWILGLIESEDLHEKDNSLPLSRW